MLNHWFYSHSTWEVAGAVCSVLSHSSVPWLPCYFHRIVSWERREEDTTMVGLSYALCGGIFAVVLAFVAVGVYQTMDKSAAIASDVKPIRLAGICLRQHAGLPDELGERIRADVNKYIGIVTKKEWPSQQAYEMEEEELQGGLGADTSDQFGSGQLRAHQSRPGDGESGDALRIVNELFGARRARLLAANAHLPDPVWQMLLFGVLSIAILPLPVRSAQFQDPYGCDDLSDVLSISLILTFIIALDYPFRGDLSVSRMRLTLGVKEVTERAFGELDRRPTGSPQSPEIKSHEIDTQPNIGGELAPEACSCMELGFAGFSGRFS